MCALQLVHCGHDGKCWPLKKYSKDQSLQRAKSPVSIRYDVQVLAGLQGEDGSATVEILGSGGPVVILNMSRSIVGWLQHLVCSRCWFGFLALWSLDTETYRWIPGWHWNDFYFGAKTPTSLGDLKSDTRTRCGWLRLCSNDLRPELMKCFAEQLRLRLQFSFF